MNYKISVVMPALNEESNIARAVRNALQSFKKVGVDGEVVIINDGSLDRTGAIIVDLQKSSPHIRAITHRKVMGIGKSFWDGVQIAQGDIVTMLPGDAENDGYEILRYLPLTEHVDIVVPFVFNRGTRSFARRIISTLYRVIINAVFGTSLNYMNGTVLYRRSILRNLSLNSPGFFYQTELLIRSIRAGYLYAEVPYGLMQREKGKSKALTLRSLFRLVHDFAKLKCKILSSDMPTLHPQSVSVLRRVEFAVEEPGKQPTLQPV